MHALARGVWDWTLPELPYLVEREREREGDLASIASVMVVAQSEMQAVWKPTQAALR